MTEEKDCRLCRAGGKVKEFFGREHTPVEKGLMAAAGVLTGVAIGILISPLKGGITIGGPGKCKARKK